MLSRFFGDQLALGAAQAAAAAAMALIVVGVARRQKIHLERETAVALLRGVVQIVAVGSVILLLLQGPVWSSAVVLLVMVLLAAAIAARRAKGIPGAFQVSLYGIGFGAGLVISLMSFLGVIEASITSLVPVGSMLVANAMNTNSLALERFKAEVESHVGEIEAGLALGAEPKTVVSRFVQSAVRASLIPRVDTLRSLGIVWIPGMMSGMVLAGTDPIYAAVYQFVLIAMIFAVAGLTSVASLLLIRPHVFTAGEQLLLRPEENP